MTDDLVSCKAFLGGTKLVPKDRLRFRPSVYGLILHEGRMLVANLPRIGKVGPPGGAVEIGETLEEALRREIREETGLEVEVRSFVGFSELFFYYDPGDVAFHAFLFYYQCVPLTFELTEHVQDLETTQPHWVEVDSLGAEQFECDGELIMSAAGRLLKESLD